MALFRAKKSDEAEKANKQICKFAHLPSQLSLPFCQLLKSYFNIPLYLAIRIYDELFTLH